MSRPKKKRPHSNPGSRMEALSAVIEGLRPKCQASIVELPDGPLILMACPESARCTRCDDARGRRRSASVRPPAPQPMPKADTAPAPEDQ
jgi:hypothetical protein